MKPQLIDIRKGLEYLMAYEGELHMAAQGHTDMLREVWSRKREAQKAFIVSSDNVAITPEVAQAKFAGTQTQSIAVVNLMGTMRANDGLSSLGIDSTCNDLRAAAANQSIGGIIMRVSTGGGEVEAAQRLHSAIMDCMAIKPIVCFVDTVCASGGVFACAPCDLIILNGTTAEMGSIGVVMQFDKEMIEYVRENIISIYADQSGDKHSMMKALLDGDFQAIATNELNPIAKAFQKIVKSGRKGVDKSALTGNMFIGNDAVKAGLADKIGTRQTAIDEVNRLVKRRKRISTAKKALQGIN